MAEPNVKSHSRYHCLSVPSICSSTVRERVWQIEVPDLAREPVALTPRNKNGLTHNLRSPPHLRDSPTETLVLQELARLSGHIDSLLVGQGMIENISSIVNHLKELPEEMSKLRTDMGLVKQEDFTTSNVKFESRLADQPIEQPLDPVQEKLKEEPKLMSDCEVRQSDRKSYVFSSAGRRSQSMAPKRTSSRMRFSSSENEKEVFNNGMFGAKMGETEMLEELEYDVRNFYHSTGYFQCIARSDRFSTFMLTIIVINALYIGIETDQNGDDASQRTRTIFIICDYMFCFGFMIELFIRFCAFKTKRDCLKDMWFKFDSVLVVLMMSETFLLPVIMANRSTGEKSSDTKVTGLVKLMRLLRLARIGRVLRALPELVAMIKGLKVASRAVGAAFLMLVMLIYVFSIAMFIVTKGTTDEFLKTRFGRLDIVMWTIMFDGTLLDNPGLIVRSLQAAHENVAVVVFMIFIGASALTVMNMLIGVLCQVVTSVAESEKDGAAVRIVKEQLLVLLKELDEDGSGYISKSEITQVLNNDVALAVLHSLRVSEACLLAHLDMYYERDEDLSCQQIMELILILRGDTQPSMRHLIHETEFAQWRVEKIVQAVMADNQSPGDGTVCKPHITFSPTVTSNLIGY